jgi:hypothetical protein
MAVRDLRFFQITSLLSHMFVPLSEASQQTWRLVMCWKQLHEDGSALLAWKKMAEL